MKVVVLVPSYRRPDLLANCLQAIEKQTRRPDQVVVVLRDTDAASRAALDQIRATSPLPIELALVSRPGQMPAMNTGLRQVRGDIVCITDDDAEPLPDWVERIEARFEEDPALDGVGGRDIVHIGGVLQPTRRVTRIGRISWYGRSTGNHAQESASPRHVDVLKGCNMAYRTSLGITFDERLRGDAYQNEVGLCLGIRKGGARLLYDPAILINHFIGTRQFGSERSGLAPDRLLNNSHNHLLVRLSHFTAWRAITYLIYTFLIGDSDTPGFVRATMIARGNPAVAARILGASLRGKVLGIRAWLHGSPLSPNADVRHEPHSG